MRGILRAITLVVLTAATAFAGGPVKVQPASGSAGKAIEVVGRGIASQADEKLKSEVEKYARDNIFGITGTLYPDGEVEFIRGGWCKSGGRQGVVLEFKVKARAKIDVGTRKLFGLNTVWKAWGVKTEQIWQVVALPKQLKSGKIVADISIHQVSATARKESRAKQAHANGFRDQVTAGIRKHLDRFAGEQDIAKLLK
jgi:hypothetical protein